ncbi:MAG TPA: methionine biosynthesis protein MetW [Clostridiales bacterium]|nr:methionine biosynthesis protein MetW [Clostridiales bacterium]
MTEKDKAQRLDYSIILSLVEKNSKVLDLGCGDGELLRLLEQKEGVEGVGIENDEQMIYSCVKKDVTVEHADIDEGLHDFPDKFFDYVIINFTLQETKKPNKVIHESLRVGKRVIVSFPNFAFLKIRFWLSMFGKTPKTEALPYRWDESPNLHYFTIKDFELFCKEEGIKVEKAVCFTKDKIVNVFPNVLAEKAVFLLSK